MRSHSVVVFSVVGALVVLIGAGAYYMGAFTDDGRFTEPVQACDLATTADVAAVLKGPAPNATDTKRSRTLIGIGGGDRDAQCKWDRTRSGSPLQAVVIRVHQRVERAPSTSAPQRAHKEFLREQANGRESRPISGLGEEADTRVDVSTSVFGPWGSTTEDVHVRYRVSNVIVDISGRLERADRAQARAALTALARSTTHALDRLATHS